MASSMKCTVCAKQQRPNSLPSVWCISCNEELCHECTTRHSSIRRSRHHLTIPTDKYSQIPKNFRRKLIYFLTCLEHGQPFLVFCKRHEILCCPEGLAKYHNECKDICHFEELRSDTDLSLLVAEVERKVSSIEETVVQLIDCSTKNLTSISKQTNDENQKIRLLQSNCPNDDNKLAFDYLSTELKHVSDRLRDRINHIHRSLNKCSSDIQDIKKTYLVFKTLPNSIEAFLVWFNIEKLVTSESKYINSLKISETMAGFVIRCDIDAYLLNLSNAKDEMRYKKTNVHVEFNGRKPVLSTPLKTETSKKLGNNMRSIEDIELRRILTIRIRESNMRGCLMLKDGRMLITSFCINDVLMINPDGSEDFRFKLRPKTAYDIAYMESENAIVGASMGQEGSIILIDLDDRTIKQTIKLDEEDYSSEEGVYSVAVVGSKIIFTGEENGIQEFDLQNESIKCVVPGALPPYTYLTVFEEKIFHSNSETDEVTCFDPDGKVIWTFHDEQILNCPVGLSTDNSGNLFVLGCRSKNLVVISPDGKHARELLWEIHDLIDPRTIFYNKLTDQILLANDQNFAFLYDVIQ